MGQTYGLELSGMYSIGTTVAHLSMTIRSCLAYVQPGNLACCILTLIAMQRITVGYTDNPSAEVNDVMSDHPHMEYLIKDMYHSLRIVSDATDPTHPHASKTPCLSGVSHVLLGTHCQYLLLHAQSRLSQRIFTCCIEYSTVSL